MRPMLIRLNEARNEGRLCPASSPLLRRSPCSSLPPSPSWREDRTDWQAVLDEARGQTVYFNAWGGDEVINGYIAWGWRADG